MINEIRKPKLPPLITVSFTVLAKVIMNPEFRENAVGFRSDFNNGSSSLSFTIEDVEHFGSCSGFHYD